MGKVLVEGKGTGGEHMEDRGHGGREWGAIPQAQERLLDEVGGGSVGHVDGDS